MKKKIILMTVTMLIASNITVFASTVNNKENQIKENQETIQNLENDTNKERCRSTISDLWATPKMKMEI